MKKKQPTPNMYYEILKDAFTDVKVEFVWLTPEIAVEYMNHNIKKNRTPRLSRLQNLIDDMCEFRWMFLGDPLRFDVLGNMIDGQYRCMAVIKTKISIPVLVITGLSEKAFDFMDCMGKNRTFCESLIAKYFTKTNVRVLEQTLKLVSSFRSDYKDGAFNSFTDKHHQGASHAQLLETALEEPEIAECVDFVCVNDKDNNRKSEIEAILPPSVASFFYYLFRQIDADKAKVFIEGLSIGYTQPNGPFGKMRRVLAALELKRKSHRIEPKLAGRMLLYTHMYAVIMAWNAYMKGTPVSLEDMKLKLKKGQTIKGMFPHIKDVVGSEKYHEWLVSNIVGF